MKRENHAKKLADQRREAVRQICRETALKTTDAPIAIAGVSMFEDGSIRCVATQVELGSAALFAKELRTLASEIEAFALEVEALEDANVLAFPKTKRA